jgi:hypothetical protein
MTQSFDRGLKTKTWQDSMSEHCATQAAMARPDAELMWDAAPLATSYAAGSNDDRGGILMQLEFTAEAGPGDFIFVPPFVPHQEINASTDETLECVLVRSDNEAVVVNLNIEPVEKPEQVLWVDPIHRA